MSGMQSMSFWGAVYLSSYLSDDDTQGQTFMLNNSNHKDSNPGYAP
ncbi:hypothetical protein Cflav_PD2359 [Pedosphaera parvula Ellin514]|uniref:Uncharacterized protein n=1 Tax=Pedosphaera parvula (strain Ellin514) TaxID=320771 RepID=B9XL21_PEDPL|nr:hypothetical protein Cflav_PD2359 [Pedosphaera parvula Ellin514]